MDTHGLALQDRIRVVEQIAQKLEAMRQTQGRQEVTLHLRPDHLGDLHLTVVTDRTTLSAHIVAETTAARQAVEEGRAQLRSTLEQKGFTLQGLDVSLSQGGERRSQPFVAQPLAPTPGSSASRRVVEPAAQAATDVRSGRTTRQVGRLDYQA